MQQESKITIENLKTEIETALEYGKSLGYTQCLNKLLRQQPESSFTQQAIDQYVKSICENYVKE